MWLLLLPDHTWFAGFTKQDCERLRNYYPQFTNEQIKIVKIEEENSEKLFNALADMYINDTSDCDGQLFCGCRQEDCELYRTKECRECLLKYIKEQMEEVDDKTAKKKAEIKSQIERLQDQLKQLDK